MEAEIVPITAKRLMTRIRSLIREASNAIYRADVESATRFLDEAEALVRRLSHAVIHDVSVREPQKRATLEKLLLIKGRRTGRAPRRKRRHR